MIFLWVLTWYSYWIFMKGQINAINIIGAVISAGLLVFSHFSPVPDAVSKVHARESPRQTAVLKTQKQEPDSIQLADKSQQLPPKSNGCPKNLDYFTKKPRPKQTPEECITCKNLIACVCLTSN
jgi:hypothetical protein